MRRGARTTVAVLSRQAACDGAASWPGCWRRSRGEQARMAARLVVMLELLDVLECQAGPGRRPQARWQRRAARVVMMIGGGGTKRGRVRKV